MKSFSQFMNARAIFAGLVLTMPLVAVADKGGAPNKKSEATTAVCTVDERTVHAYSCKALSNVVLWCGVEGAQVYVKHDDILDENGLEIVDGIFDCGVDADGVAIPGPVSMVAIKSGSQRNVKSDAPHDVDNAPSGSGLFLGDLLMCDNPDFMFPLEGECDVAEAPDETGG
ncbi:MAG: hypothetical protein OER97_04705 [Gammaproteobacteria bacterium]|nr:hypothetical protein [Gammaproteobacteria bacterium]